MLRTKTLFLISSTSTSYFLDLHKMLVKFARKNKMLLHNYLLCIDVIKGLNLHKIYPCGAITTISEKKIAVNVKSVVKLLFFKYLFDL